MNEVTEIAINPIVQARNFSSISTTKLAKELEVSRQYITRTEQGLYEKPNNKLLDWTAETLNSAGAVEFREMEYREARKEILDMYLKWQWHKRYSTKEDKILRPIEINKHYMPDVVWYHKIFSAWRARYWSSTHFFCVDMCMHPGPVTDYENGKLTKMPSDMRDVMQKMGLIGEGFKTNER